MFYVQDGEIYLKRLIPGIHRSQNIFNLASNTTVCLEETRGPTVGWRGSVIFGLRATIMLNVAEPQMQKIKTQWLIKDNWHFHFPIDGVSEHMDENHGLRKYGCMATSSKFKSKLIIQMFGKSRFKVG